MAWGDLKSKDKVNELLSIDNRNEFVALIAFGYPDENPQGERKR